jgi:hypothetical protein
MLNLKGCVGCFARFAGDLEGLVVDDVSTELFCFVVELELKKKKKEKKKKKKKRKIDFFLKNFFFFRFLFITYATFASGSCGFDLCFLFLSGLQRTTESNKHINKKKK